jgi:hypothetical protein
MGKKIFIDIASQHQIYQKVTSLFKHPNGTKRKQKPTIKIPFRSQTQDVHRKYEV